tara:strand:+ start:411 stop:617 length:207 start_codon:yes stop_codon:yes gene_type:complete
MNTAEEALKQIEIHQAECQVLREAIDDKLRRIERRLDSGGTSFTRLERMIWGNSVAIVAVLKGMEYFQ